MELKKVIKSVLDFLLMSTFGQIFEYSVIFIVLIHCYV